MEESFEDLDWAGRHQGFSFPHLFRAFCLVDDEGQWSYANS